MIKMTKKQAGLYKQRWRKIELAQTRELADAPMSLKFKQLCWLMNSFHVMQPDKRREQQADTVRRRWSRLKKNVEKSK